MNITQLLQGEVEEVYRATFGLIDLVDNQVLAWKPDSGENWMTTGQLLFHLTSACGFCCKGFVTGDWSLPDGADLAEMTEEDMMPAAEKMPAVTSVAEARTLLEQDKELALAMIEQAGEIDLVGKELDAPWAPGVQAPLGRHLLHMVDHLASHKAQLYYYLKLMGKPVNTANMWGMSL